ncbi:ig-like domain-containing protein [Caerostris extrusa]|uniref:Ig-like domain-containing protein n=1 Tax=Caerostris extrusa TaxID=172846 RepID=A0AAV4WPR1_CAEEX|nr:ig-like domain-containing protein [Caerostris extrusa]
MPWNTGGMKRFTTWKYFLSEVCLGVEIRRLSVPRWVENGTEKSVTLDCDYVYNQNDIRLVVKWFFEDNLEPVYQWIPELGVRHTSGILHGRLDLNYTVNTVDTYSRYRALKISQPSTELSGKYTCLVTSLWAGLKGSAHDSVRDYSANNATRGYFVDQDKRLRGALSCNSVQLQK